MGGSNGATEAQPEFESVAATAARAGVSKDLVRDAIERGEIEARRFGDRILIPKDALDRLPLAKKQEA